MGFSIDSLMSPLIAFNVYSTTNTLSAAPPFPFVFPNIALNEGNYWNATSSKFKAPRAGVYIFSYSTAATAYSQTSFGFVVNNTVLNKAYILSTDHPGVDLTGRSVVVKLNANDYVWITGNGKWSYSDGTQLAAFKSFYYSPVSGVQVAWEVDFTSTTTSVGPGSFVNFASVLTNVGNAVYNSSTIVIPTAGTYYMSLAVTQSLNYGFFVYLYQNGNIVLAMLKTTGGSNKDVTREGTVIVKCTAGDRFTVYIDSGIATGFTSFSGFLLSS